jgi:hypothetical protein
MTTQLTLFDMAEIAPPPKPIPPTIPDDFLISANSEVDAYYESFEPSITRLHQDILKGKITTGGYSGQSWWRSRFSDFLTRNNTAPASNSEFLYRLQGYELWDKIWQKYHLKMTTLTP